MKKLLFTLCAVLAGFAAYAGSMTVNYVYNNAAIENNEITVTPGSTTQIYVSVTGMEGIVEGFQEQWVVKDVAGNAYNYPAYTDFTPEVAPKVYFKLNSNGKNAFSWYGMSTLTGVNGMGQSTPGDGVYRIIAASTAVGAVWIGSVDDALEFLGYDDIEDVYSDYNCTAAAFTQGNVIRFQVITTQDWAEEYATVDFDQEFDKVSWRGEAAGKLGLPDLKIKNANWQAPLEDLTGTIVIGDPDENGYVTVAYNGEETGVTVTVEGYEVVDGKIQLPEYGTYTLNVTASAQGYNPKTASKEVTWTAPAVAPEAPSISIVEAEDYLTMTVTVTAAEGCTLIVNGTAQNSNTYTYTVNRATDIYTADDAVEVTAKAVKDNLESEEASDSKAWTVAEKPNATTPVITFAETKDGDVVTAVTVQIANWTKATINGEEFTNTRDDVKTFTANYTADQEITVVAENDPGYPYVKATAEDTYTLKKLEKKNVPAPEVTPQTGDDAVTLNITWPESDGTHVIKVNGEESTETSFPRQDADYTVELDIYVTEGATCNESAHYTETITIPKKVTTPTEQTGQPTFHESFKPNHNAVYITIDNAETEPNATIFYQITYPDGTTSGWLEYTPGQEIAIFGPNEGGQQGTHVVEAYAVAPGKLPSETIKLEPSLGPTTGIDELIDGKAIANVRYFNMAGQEMQEANGMTIVVTTYTDGTTSAVKVMK